MDLYLLNELNKLESGSSSSGSSAGSMFLPNHPTTGDETTWPYITRVGDRQQTDNWTWSTSSPYTSFYTYGGNGRNDAEFGVFNAIGKPYVEDNQRTSYDSGSCVEVGFLNGGRHGGPFSMYEAKWNGTSYPPFRTTVMFLKNKSGSTQNLNIQCKASSNWQSGHDGASVWIGEPNYADKSQVTDVSWVSDTLTSTNTDLSGSVSKSNIEDGKTCVILIMNSLYYYQDSSNVGCWQDLASFSYQYDVYNLGFRPDYDMYKTALLARDADWGASAGAFSYSHSNAVRNLYRMCAYNYPEET